jgi:drug/metabolite transporter (DMT)-like permease
VKNGFARDADGVYCHGISLPFRYAGNMTSELNDLVDQISLTPYQAIGIPIALVGAVFLSVGAQLQHRGVGKVEDQHGDGTKNGLSLRQLLQLARRPSWLFGSLMLGLAIVFQLVSLGFAPLIVVQPLGVVAMVLTNVINSRVNGVSPDRKVTQSIALAVGSIGIFVTISAIYAVEHPFSDQQLWTIVILLLAVLGVTLTTFAVFRDRLRAMFYIVAAGILYGFVVTLAKVVINRVQSGQIDMLIVVCIAALVSAVLLGGYFVQTAYSVGSPDLVIAGLTVVDPLVAVGIAVVVLGEAQNFPPFAVVGFVVAGVTAIFGVVRLARHHPQTHR